MYQDFFKLFDTKNFQNFQTPYNFDAIQEANRSTLAAWATAGQLMADSLQAVGRRNSEALRETVEDFLTASKDLVNGASPEAAASKQADYAKAAFENAQAHMQEVTELLAKSGQEAFQVLNQRFAENLEEATANVTQAAAKSYNSAKGFAGQAKKAAGYK